MSFLYVKDSRSQVLIFVSGKDATRQLKEIIETGLDYRERHSPCPVRIEELNGDMSAQEQEDGFEGQGSNNARRIIIATEVAETGLRRRDSERGHGHWIREESDLRYPGELS